jgi:hypothetical protein
MLQIKYSSGLIFCMNKDQMMIPLWALKNQSHENIPSYLSSERTLVRRWQLFFSLEFSNTRNNFTTPLNGLTPFSNNNIKVEIITQQQMMQQILLSFQFIRAQEMHSMHNRFHKVVVLWTTLPLCWNHLRPQNTIWAEQKVVFSGNGRMQPPCGPAIVNYTNSSTGWITSRMASYDLFVEFWKTTCLSLFPSLPVLISFFPQPSLNCSLQIQSQLLFYTHTHTLQKSKKLLWYLIGNAYSKPTKKQETTVKFGTKKKYH